MEELQRCPTIPAYGLRILTKWIFASEARTELLGILSVGNSLSCVIFDLIDIAFKRVPMYIIAAASLHTKLSISFASLGVSEQGRRRR
jgi:hypothetical protein